MHFALAMSFCIKDMRKFVHELRGKTLLLSSIVIVVHSDRAKFFQCQRIAIEMSEICQSKKGNLYKIKMSPN